MTHRLLGTALAALLLALSLAVPAAAQIGGTPGSGPLTPDGPRRGLGPPSITDNVPDLRLRGDAGGIPGAGPPVGAGSLAVPSFGDSGRGPGYGAVGRRPGRAIGHECRTPRRICTLVRMAPVGTGCSCRLADGSRARGRVVP